MAVNALTHWGYLSATQEPSCGIRDSGLCTCVWTVMDSERCYVFGVYVWKPVQ